MKFLRACFKIQRSPVSKLKQALKRLLLVGFIGCALLNGSAHAAAAWLDDLPRAQAQAKSEGKLVLIHFSGSDWCGWCMKLRKEVFLKPEFESYARSNLVLVAIDFPKRKPQPTALQQANQQLAEQFQVQGFPTLLVLDSQGGSLGRLSYGQGGAKMFLAELEKLIHPPPETPPSRMAAKKNSDSKAASKLSEVGEPGRKDLILKKISGTKERRQAPINSHTFAVGETASVKVAAGRVRVHCVEIRDKSVIVTVNGQKEKQELKLAEGT